MLTDRGKGMLVAAGLLWLASRLFGIREVGMAALAALALVIVALAYTTAASSRLTARRRVYPSRLFFDDVATVEVQVRNTGRLPTALLQVEDGAPPTLTEGGRFLVSPLRPGAGTAMRYELVGRHRGRFEIGPLTVRLRDPFGIGARARQFESVDYVVVYPPVWRLSAAVRLGGAQGAGGEGRPRPLASGDELSNVREYVRGDDLRKVHWRSTAHRGKLMVRQDEAPQNPQATLVLDTRSMEHHGTGPTSSFEAAVSATASIAYHLAERSYATALITAPLSAPARAVNWQQTLESLAIIQPDMHVDLKSLWLQLSQGTGGSGLLVTVVVVPDARMLREMVRAGRSFTSRVAVIVDAESHRSRGPNRDAITAVEALRVSGWRATLLRRGDRIDDAWRQLALHQRAGTPVGGAR